MKIIITKDYNIVKDGGSHMHNVFNKDECGYEAVIQDFSIGSRQTPKEGRWLGILPPPNHLSSQRIQLNAEDLDFV